MFLFLGIICGAIVCHSTERSDPVPRRLHWKASSHVQMWKSEAFKYDRWVWLVAVFLQSVPWFGANAARYFKSTFEIKKLSWSWFPRRQTFLPESLAASMPIGDLKITAAEPRVEEKLVYGTKGITACPSEVWLWISQIGHWRLYHCTNCVQSRVKPHSFCFCGF